MCGEKENKPTKTKNRMIRIGFGCFVVSILVLATLCHFVPSSKEYNVTKGIFTLVAQLGLLAGLIGTIIKEKRGRASFRCFLASIILGGIFPFLLNYLLERGQPCCLGCTLSGFVIFPIIFTLVGFAQGLIGIIKKETPRLDNFIGLLLNLLLLSFIFLAFIG